MSKALEKKLKSGKVLQVWAEKEWGKYGYISVRVFIINDDGSKEQLNHCRIGALNDKPEYLEKGYVAQIWTEGRFFPLTAEENQQIEDVVFNNKVI